MKVLFRFALLFAIYSFQIPAAIASPTKQQNVSADPRSLELNEQGVAAMQSHNFTAAEDIFKKAVSSDPKNLTAVFNLAGAYLAEKKNAAAISLLKEYVDKNVNDVGIFVRLGDAYFTNKEVKLAIVQYEKAHALAPKYIGLSAKMGTVYTLLNQLKQAEISYREAVELNQKDGQSLANLSSILLANSKFEESVQTAKRALQVHSSPELYITIGNAYEQLKDPKNALIAFQRAQDLGDSTKELSDKIEQLKKKN